MLNRVLYIKFALYYGAYTLGSFGLRALFGRNPLESLDAFVIFGLTFYLVKGLADRQKRNLSEREQRELIGVFGVIVFGMRAVLLVPQFHDAGTAIMASLLTSAMQIVVVVIAVFAVRAYASFRRP